MILGDFAAFLGCEVFLNFFSLPDPFLDFCSSSVPESFKPVSANSCDWCCFRLILFGSLWCFFRL